MELFSDVGSIPTISTKQVLDEHLLFQRRICRQMCSLIQKQNAVSAFKLKRRFRIGYFLNLNNCIHKGVILECGFQKRNLNLL